MKVLVFGRGVIGTQYGWALEKAGHSVEFYVRPGRAAALGSMIALDIFDLRTSFMGTRVTERWPVRFLEDLPTDHDYDLILVSVQHYRFAEAADFLASRTGRASILVFSNFWADPPTAASALPRDQLVWGFPGAGGGFDETGTLRGALFKQVQFGKFGAALTQRDLAVRNLFRASGFKVVEHRNFRSWLWAHFVFDAGLESQALRAGSMARMMDSTAHGRQAVLNVRELLPLLEARGVNRKEFPAYLSLSRFPAWIGSLVFKSSYRFHRPVRSVVDNHANTEELRAVCRDVLNEAHRLNINVPRLEAAKPYFDATTLPGQAGARPGERQTP